jgi:hypothetical protein
MTKSHKYNTESQDLIRAVLYSFIFAAGELSPVLLRSCIGLMYQPLMIDCNNEGDCGAICTTDGQGNRVR